MMIHDVLSQKEYKTKFIYSFIIILVIAVFLMNFVSIFGILQGRILITEIVDYYGIVFLIAFSFLSALSLTLHFYRYDRIKSRQIGKGSIGIFGAFLGIFTSACTICYPLVLTLLGVPAALAVLPFGGLEVQALSILLLLLSIYFLSKECKKCRV
jgi:hypothetical protein